MIHPASKQWPSQAGRATSKTGQHGNIIKPKRWWWKNKATDRQRQVVLDLNTSLQIRHLLACVKGQEVCYQVVKVPLSLPNKLWLLLLRNPHPPLSIIRPRFCSSNCFITLPSLFHSLHLCPPPSCITNALPICVYETNCCHPSLRNHCLDFHILLLLGSLRYILPTFIY